MSPEVPRFYVNQVNVSASPFDVALDFGFRVGDEDPEPQVRVLMSLEHAASLRAILAGLLDAYEREVGAIPNVVQVAEVGDEGATPEGAEQT
jgi:hypothetical protein